MNLFNKLFLVKEIRSKAGVLHFRRWRFLELPFFRVYLHNILKADEDKHEHDHPWSFYSLILKGGYTEALTLDVWGPFKSYLLEHGVGSIIHRKAKDSHQIRSLKNDKPVWSLVFAYGFERPWGYNTEAGWIDKDEYRRLKRERLSTEKAKQKPSFAEDFTTERLQQILDFCGNLKDDPILSTWDEVVASKPMLKEAFDIIKPVYDKYMEFSTYSIKTEDFKSVFDMSLAIATLCHHKLIRQTYTVFVDGKILNERWDSLTTLGNTLGLEELDARKAEVIIIYRRTDCEQHLTPSIKEDKPNVS